MNIFEKAYYSAKRALFMELQAAGLIADCHTREGCVHKDKAIRENTTEKDLDKMLKDSFPASDPPSTY